MSGVPDNIVIGMAVPKDNYTLSAIINILDESIKSETAIALGNSHSSSENRAWQCGRADALGSLKELITGIREDALKQRGMHVD
jgi:hypothetical protein